MNENVEKFQSEWNTYLEYNGIKFSTRENKKRANIWIPLIRTIGWRFLLLNCLAFVHYSIVFLGPQVNEYCCFSTQNFSHEPEITQ